jgi:hypothetical protein
MNEHTNIALGNSYHDGFDDPDDGNFRSIIRGAKLKFTNAAKWITGDGGEINAAREFLVVELVRVVQKWIDGKPVETRILAPEENFPDIDELNTAAPKEEWRDHYGKAAGPWQKSYVGYLLDPATMACFTYPTSTVGGFQAFHTLKDETRRARLVHGANVFPIVTLGDVDMPTGFGPRRRPAFIVIRYVPIGPAAEPKPAIAAPASEEPPKPTPKKGDSDGKMGDGIPW